MQEYKERLYRKFIEGWLSGTIDGTIGKKVKEPSKHIRRYLIEKYGEKCSICGWCQVHPVTGKVPVQIDHVDGNAENQAPSNLRLLCPNCHSLTSTFGNLNAGNGRAWRRNMGL